MVFARWQSSITDDEGNVLPGATVEVRREISGAPLVPLYSDREGAVSIGNPFAADSEGFAAFHVVGGAYKITVTSGAFSRVHRYVGIGLAGESDGRGSGIEFTFDDGTSDADPGIGHLRLNNATLSSVTKLFIDNESAGGADITAWLDSWDDAGVSGNRGTVTITNGDGSGLFFGMVTGSVANDSGYRDITVSHIASYGEFADESPVFLSFVVNGAPGVGDVVGPSGGVVNNEIALYSSTTGKAIKGSSGATTATVGAGKQTLWIPAGAMIPRVTNGAGAGSIDSGSSDITIPVLDFDTTTGEFAHFQIAMPKQWNKGTVTFQPFWTAGGGSAAQTVRWTLAGVAISDDDPLNATMGTAQNSDDALIATGDLHVGPESSAITIGGTPVDSDLVAFQLGRDVANDNLSVDARLIGIKLHITTNVNTDA